MLSIKRKFMTQNFKTVYTFDLKKLTLNMEAKGKKSMSLIQ